MPFEFFEADHDAVVSGAPDGLMLPKAEGADSVFALLARLATRSTVAPSILPIATETPAAIFGLGSYAGVAEFLCGLTWGAEDLPAAIVATASRESDGRFTAPYELARYRQPGNLVLNVVLGTGAFMRTGLRGYPSWP